jgi:hypothetical protein
MHLAQHNDSRPRQRIEARRLDRLGTGRQRGGKRPDKGECFYQAHAADHFTKDRAAQAPVRRPAITDRDDFPDNS